MPETHKLAPRSDGATTTADNAPPPDPFLANLEEQNAALIGEAATLEMETVKLPKEPKSDDDVAKISAWVVKARALFRKTEKTRVIAGADILAMQRTVNSFFGDIKTALSSKADAMEQRSAPYLAAKKAAAEAKAQAEAAASAREAKRLADEAEAARQRQVAAQEAAAAAQRKIDEATHAAENAHVAGDHGEAAFAERDADTSIEEMRVAGQQALAASVDAADATKAANKAAQAAGKAAVVAGGGYRLSRTAGGGAAATVSETWSPNVTDWPLVYEGLGLLGQYLADLAVRAALDRAAAAMPRPVIPGVEWISSLAVQTRALRK